MTRKRSAGTLAFAMAALLTAAPAWAQAGKSLGKCQNVVAKESGDYIRALSGAVGGCLKRMSTAVIRDGATTAEAAADNAPDCEAALRRIVNSDSPADELGRAFNADVDESCDPATNPELPHTEADLLTVGANTISAARLGLYCSNFGGDGSIDRYAEWRDCLRNSADCQARQAIAVQWPRVLEYFEALRTALAALPAGSSRDDALAALAAIDSALEGVIDDNRPDLVCGQAEAVVLASDLEVCRERRGIPTPPGPCPDAPYFQDAMIRAGEPRSYVDNGDGTVTDENTGLMWEKLGDDSSIHDRDDRYNWADASAQKIAALNAGGGFAGHKDWRLPNRRELESLHHPAHHAPAIDPLFDVGCVPGCTGIDCGCTASILYWSSTTYEPTPSLAWSVDFDAGAVAGVDKASLRGVRAVREGR